jgi:hypothetical protein
MCCFSGPVTAVGDTRIFARATEGDRQLLVYAMKVALSGEVAMVLPIPTPPRAPEDAVRWVDLSSCPGFFTDLETLFPQPQSFGPGPIPGGIPMAARAPLLVADVGDFEASFVPTIADFDRLDPRFRLPPSVFGALPQYADWGFAVFKLRAHGPPPSVFTRARQALLGGAPRPPEPFHPMAFELPRRDPSTLFFPTVHVHDGAVHPRAHFDHALYAQAPAAPAGWTEGWAPHQAGLHRPAFDWLDRQRPVLRRRIVGEEKNEDVVVALAP